jgi:hypothetical protein
MASKIYVGQSDTATLLDLGSGSGSTSSTVYSPEPDNLLINSWFNNPIRQLGCNNGSGSGGRYVINSETPSALQSPIDGWKAYGTGAAYQMNDYGGLVVVNSGSTTKTNLVYTFEKDITNYLMGKQLILIIGVYGSKTYCTFDTLPAQSEMEDGMIFDQFTVAGGAGTLIVYLECVGDLLAFRMEFGGSSALGVFVHWAKLAIGTASTVDPRRYTPPNPALELKKVQRYVYNVFAKTSDYVFDNHISSEVYGIAYSATVMYAIVPVSMRVKPAILTSAMSTFRLLGSATKTVSAISVYSWSADSVCLQITSSGMTAGYTYLLDSISDAAYIFLDATV